MKLTEIERHREDAWRWMDGTQLLAVLLERFADGGPITITKEEVLRARFGSTHPVVFTVVNDDTDKAALSLKVVRPET
jgi:hypothetical protein